MKQISKKAEEHLEEFAKWIRENEYEWSAGGYWFRATYGTPKNVSDSELKDEFIKYKENETPTI